MNYLNPIKPHGLSDITVEPVRSEVNKEVARIVVKNPDNPNESVVFHVSVVKEREEEGENGFSKNERTAILNREISKVLYHIQYGEKGNSFYERAKSFTRSGGILADLKTSNYQQIKYDLQNLAAKISGISPKAVVTSENKPLWSKIIQNPFVKAITAVALSPILIVGFGLAALNYGVQLGVRSYRENRGETLYGAVRELKSQEKNAKHDYFTTQFEGKQKEIDKAVAVLDPCISVDETSSFVKSKLDRYLQRIGANIPLDERRGFLKIIYNGMEIRRTQPLLGFDKNPDEDQAEKFQKLLEDRGIKPSTDGKEIYYEIQKELQAIKNYNEATTNFKAAYEIFKLELSKPITPNRTVNDKNKAVLQAFRLLITSEYYQLVKYDADNTITRFIHEYAAGIWSQVKVMDAYQKMGQAVIEKAEERLQTNNASGEKIVEILEQTRPVLEKTLHTDHGIGKISYAISHPKQTLGSLASMGGDVYYLAEALGASEYDGHGTLTNIPSLQGTTTIDLKVWGTASIHNVYGGSPTVGDFIAPEMEALLQAAENNLLAPNKRRPGVSDKILYTNFQDMQEEGTGEYNRSKAIMLLNQKYPLSFQGITLTKDSEFYLMNDERKTYLWPGSEEMAKEMQALLLDPASFDLSKCHETGFYFPGGMDEWKNAIEVIFEEASAVFKDKKGGGKELRGAFQEYVYASLQNYIEVKSAFDLGKQGIENPVIHSQRACKENIDRGGAANAAYLHTRIPTEDLTRAKTIIGAIKARSLAVRDRLILQKRLPQVLSFIKLVPQKEFSEHQNKMLKRLFPGLDNGFGTFKLSKELPSEEIKREATAPQDPVKKVPQDPVKLDEESFEGIPLN